MKISDLREFGLMPGLFVVLWSTGFIGAKYGLPYAEPFTFLAIRFTLVVALLALIVAVVRPAWPSTPLHWIHSAVVGLLIHGVYLGGVFAALQAGVSPGVSALIVGAQPLLSATLVGRFTGERVTTNQWLGLLLGLTGVALVVWNRLDTSNTAPIGFLFNTVALLGITVGTLYQKRFVADTDLRSSGFIQYSAALIMMLLLAFGFETRIVEWTAEFIFALAWLGLVLSLGAVYLLYILIRRGTATRVTSWFYLVPPVTALMAFLLFNEQMGFIAIAGMALTVTAVALVNRQQWRQS